MPPIVLTLLQGLFLLLLYLFVARAVRAVLRDTVAAAPVGATAPRPKPAQPSRPARKRAARPVRELVVHSPGQRPQVLRLDAGELTFGRGDAVDVVLADPYASERHARVYSTGDGWVLADAGSTNGTYLNGKKVSSPTPLSPGDQVGIGKTTLEVRA